MPATIFGACAPTGDWLSGCVLARPRPMQDHFGGKWGLPPYSPPGRLPPAISVRDFLKFKNTVHKNGHECMVSHTLRLAIGNAACCHGAVSRIVGLCSYSFESFQELTEVRQ